MSTIPVPYDTLQSDPYPDYPTVDLTTAKYPEKAVWGAGNSAMNFGKLSMVVEAWPDLSLGDYFDVHLNDPNTPAASATVAGMSNRYFLMVDKAQVPEGEVEVFSRVVRVGSQQESRSSTQLALFKQSLPGGYDLKVWEPWHSELKLSLEGLPEGSSINAGMVTKGVWCLIGKYANIRQNDKITIVWAGIYFDYIVSPADVSAAGPLRIQVPDDVINKGNQYGTVYVVFKVMDVVGNPSGGMHPYSKPYAVRAELDKDQYEPPIFCVNGKEALEVDLNTQSLSTFTLDPVLPRYTPKPDPLHMVTVCMRLSLPGQPDEILRLPAVPDMNKRGEPINIPVSFIAQAAGGQFGAWVEVHDANGTQLGKSSSVDVRVRGVPTRMPAPQVTPIEGTLLPFEADITVTIPDYQPHNADWIESLVLMQGSVGGGGLQHIETRQAGSQGSVFDLSKTDLKQFEYKGPFSIFYRTNDGLGLASSIRESDRVTAEIGFRMADLPEPIVKFAQDGNIDPKEIASSILFISFPYVGASPGSTVHWSAVGANAASSDSGSFVINTANEGPLLPSLWIAIKKQVLLGNVGGSIRFSYSVQKDATPTTPGKFLRSEVLKLTVGPKLVLARPTILEADKLLPGQLYADQVVNGATVRVSYKSMVVDDDIIVSWKGEFGISFVEIHTAADPKTNSVDVRIPPEIIALAMRQGGNSITVQYRFLRGQKVRESDPLVVRLSPVRSLPSPMLNSIDDKIFPLLALDHEAKITVDMWPFMRKDQRKFLTVTGTLTDGSKLQETLYTADKVTEDEVAEGVSVFAPVKRLRDLKEGTVLTIDFKVSFAELDDPNTGVSFGSRDYRVQAVSPTLPAPEFENKPGPVLSVDPLSYMQGAVVAVAYAGMTPTQQIDLEWIAPNATIATIASQHGDSSGRIEFAISPQIILQSTGRTISLRYKVTTSIDTIWSDPQVLTVGTILADNFPQALINKLADKGTLNQASYAGHAYLALPQWLGIAPGQNVWITLHSLGVAQLDVLKGYVVKAADVTNGLANILVSRAWLEKLANSSVITVEVLVTLDGSAKRENAVAFKPTTYKVVGQLRIDQNAMILSGVSIKNANWPRTGLSSIGNSASRVPSGGAGPYHYSSNNPRVASVDVSGYVIGHVNGSATVTVSDKNGSSTSYAVYVSNVYTIVLNDSLMSWATAKGWAASIGGFSIMDAAIYDVLRVNGAGAPIFSRQFWTASDPYGNGLAPFINNSPNVGAVALRNINAPLPAACLVPLY
ncbi:hypothetical protein [Pseudomonas trivialis]|uniref:BIG2 domain-containing protein n=1 Tax=Pseudomonas trivialis TaxID=200450 RepID=A0A0R2ZLH3_9PSED|nr:hypothetical protein [Pseudomonas trivialis]KRP61353.1 hypothetical protein TU79_08315 [Pseudomonas trivialis]SDT03703.1 hypothetical protein SAMN04490205_4515 [Pseudomonas trivialis]